MPCSRHTVIVEVPRCDLEWVVAGAQQGGFLRCTGEVRLGARHIARRAIAPGQPLADWIAVVSGPVTLAVSAMMLGDGGWLAMLEARALVEDADTPSGALGPSRAHSRPLGAAGRPVAALRSWMLPADSLPAMSLAAWAVMLLGELTGRPALLQYDSADPAVSLAALDPAEAEHAVDALLASLPSSTPPPPT